MEEYGVGTCFRSSMYGIRGLNNVSRWTTITTRFCHCTIIICPPLCLFIVPLAPDRWGMRETVYQTLFRNERRYCQTCMQRQFGKQNSGSRGRCRFVLVSSFVRWFARPSARCMTYVVLVAVLRQLMGRLGRLLSYSTPCR